VNDSIKVGSTGLGYDMKILILTAVTEDGCENTEQVTVIFDFGNCFGTPEMSTGSLRIYPNPGKGIFSIETGAEMRWRELKICSAEGKDVFSVEPWPLRASGGPVTIDLSALSPGIYILTLTGDSGHLTARVVILP
jgi:hypothetical protein